MGGVDEIIKNPPPIPEPIIDPVTPPPKPAPPKYSTLAEIQKNLAEGTVPFYEACYRILEYDPGTEAQIKAAAKRATSGEIWEWYKEVERLTKAPAILISVIHAMECNNNPRGCLHNGEAIVGTDRLTTLVPKGRGPFNKYPTLKENWIDAALDAISISSTWKRERWTLGAMLLTAERFNGWGYVTGAGRDELSPYIWACTNINDGFGKYVRDGFFDPNAPANGQVGIAAIIKELERQGVLTLEFES